VKGDWQSRGFSTRAIHAGQAPDPTTGAVTVPIYATSTYVQPELGRHLGYEYARVQNPTRFALEANLAAITGGTTGHAFASGMSAIAALMTFVKSGEHAVFSRNVYGGTFRFLTQVLNRYGVESSWVDSSDLGAIRAAIRPETRLIYVETPTNPMMEITDIRGAAAIAKEHGLLFAVDNTFLSPYFQRPLELGADFVVHSTTKFLNGHSDSIGGALVAKSKEHGDWLFFVQKSEGAILSPFDSFLVLRGIKTLAVRMERHEANGRALAEMLDAHPKVARVLWPGLPSHPGHEVQKRQATGFGALLTFDLGSYDAAKRFLDKVEVMSLAESLGGVETLTSHPASMTHASVPAEKRAELGITDGLVRISAGIEDTQDLLDDCAQALDAV
jgi:cystathionine beta-lyase/cystathionine gamma-synthase